MKRRLFWLLAFAGAIWLYLRRGARRPEPVDRVPPSDPAEELRRKLDETKKQEQPPTPDPAEAGPEPAPAEVLGVEPPPTEPSAPVGSEDLEARRREIHEQARSAADEMRRSSSD